MENINETIEKFKYHGMKVPENKLFIKVENPKQMMEKYLSMFLNNYQWLDEYDSVCEWLSDNKGRGLLLFGDCGRGKTILSQWVIPAILLECCGKVLKTYNVNEMNTGSLEVINKLKLFGVDDIGTEEMAVDFGNKRMYFAEIMDIVEKQNKLIVVSSNLNSLALQKKYGERILDRIVATTKQIKFTGQSLRG